MLVPDRGDPTMKIGLASLRRIVPFKLYWPTLIGATGFPGTFAAGGTLDIWDSMYRLNLRTAVASCQAACLSGNSSPTKSNQEKWP